MEPYLLQESILWLFLLMIGIIIKRSQKYASTLARLKGAKNIKKMRNNPIEIWIGEYSQNVEARNAAGKLTRIEKILAPIINLRKYTGGTVANLISVLRILLAIIVTLLLIIHKLTAESAYLISAQAIYIIGSILDLLDGATARARKEISKLGKILDPIADKILVASTIFILKEYLSDFAFLAVVRQELFLMIITGLKLMAEKLPFSMATQANRWGKIKTIFEFAGCIALLSCPFFPMFSALAETLFIISIPLAMGSIINYIASVKFNRVTAN